MERKPTKEAYSELQQAYDFFNRTLFRGELPACLITLQRERQTYGYFSGSRFANRSGGLTDEIALNPAHFAPRSLRNVLSTLVHEMVHLWQHHFGTPGRGRYHNREWAQKMEAVGLTPSDTGKAGGKKTGDRVSHYVARNGAFAKAATRLFETGYDVSWIDRIPADAKAGDRSNRQKYTCGECGLNAWAKPGAKLVCGECSVAMA